VSTRSGAASRRTSGRGLVTRSTPEWLRHSLDRLWEAVRLEGQHGPVAIPVVGSGLARIHELDRVELIRLMVKSFLAQQPHGRISDELRIVVLPWDAARMDMGRVDEVVTAAITEALPRRDTPVGTGRTAGITAPVT